MAQTKLLNNDLDLDASNPTVFKKINTGDVRVSPFHSYKKWMLYSGSATSSALPLKAVYSAILPALGTELTFNDAANSNGSLQTVTWNSFNQAFYRNVANPLYVSASALSIPNRKVGDGIKPMSFTFTSSTSGSFESDSRNRIIDSGISETDIIGDETFYEGFNTFYNTANQIGWTGIEVVPGIPTTSVRQQPVGYAAKFAGAGYYENNLTGRYNRNTNYAVSFWISASNATANNQLVLGKISSSITPTYPFQVELDSTNKIRFTVAGSTQTKLQVTSSAITGWTNIVCQKSGSYIQLWRNGVLEANTSSSLLIQQINPSLPTMRIDNLNPLKIGGYGPNSSNLTGFLDEVRVWNKSLTQTNVDALNDRTEGGTFLQTRVVGNVFPRHGLAVFSSPDYRVSDLLNTSYTASYRSTVTITELSATARVARGDFNATTNLSVTQDDDSTFMAFVTGSDFTPYITTIGLYDDMGRLLAIGKLAQPIKKRTDVDMSFVLRIDLDNKILLQGK